MRYRNQERSNTGYPNLIYRPEDSQAVSIQKGNTNPTLKHYVVGRECGTWAVLTMRNRVGTNNQTGLLLQKRLHAGSFVTWSVAIIWCLLLTHPLPPLKRGKDVEAPPN